MIYLDSAATSFLKPEAVSRAVTEAMRTMTTPGRGSHGAAIRAADKCYECRENLARLFNVERPENIAFTFNATHGLNIAINSVVEAGSRVLVSPWEHNSVLRPLYAKKAQIKIIDAPLFEPEAFLCRARELLPEVDAVVCTHVSNVFGYVLPIFELGRLCAGYNKPFILDASQSAGAMDVDFTACGADFLACPGHKSLLGPQGTGVLICKNEANPLLYGGSGSDSLSKTMPPYLPDTLEAGTHNVPGIAGLNESVKFLLRRGTENIRRHERMLLEIFAGRVQSGRLFYCPDERLQTSAVSLRPGTVSCEALADSLSRSGIAVRSGLHCAPLAHESAGTLATGTVRFSFSPFITAAQAQYAGHMTEKLLKRLQ